MLAARGPALLGVARDGGVGRGGARVDQREPLGVALGGVAGLALHPRQVAAGVQEQGLRDGRRAQAHRDNVLLRVIG
jgi:hypothetical protein